ncbi:MAG TPA: DUF3306 domain-containing protein [Burkholderiaceae bacterium]|nr:DUF3306 domain-containing protein [Burkholderiaceae bacterium]
MPPRARPIQPAAAGAVPAQVEAQGQAEAVAAPTLDEVAALPSGAEVARFVAPGVARQVKNAALKKLFADPHFNVMDGLDVYIEDFGRPDPLPAAMLQSMLDSPSFRYLTPPPEPASAPPSADVPDAQDTPDAPPAPESAATVDPARPAEPPALAGQPPCPAGSDEDPDLRLQPYDAADARPAGAGAPGAGGDARRLA